MKQTIIGLVGETGSGKDTVAEYLKDAYGAKLTRFADPIKDTLSIYFDKLSKEDQQWMYSVFKDRFGANILSRAMKKRIEDAQDKLIVVNGLRMPSDLEFIRSLKDSQVLYITASEKIRWQRVIGRKEKTDDNIALETFQELDKKETETHVPDIGAKADRTIINEQTLDFLLSETDSFMESLGVEKKNDHEKRLESGGMMANATDKKSEKA